MERLAARTPFSKGIIYQHFSSKEDVLAALCVESHLFRLEMLEKAALFKGRSRERALAMAKADFIIYKLHGEFWRTEQLVSIFSLTGKVSPARRAFLDAVTVRCADVALGVARDAISTGELNPAPGLTPEKLLLALLGVTRGIYHIDAEAAPIRGWAADLPSTHEQLFSLACDAFGWRPLSSEWDYAATARRIWAEVFPFEAAQLRLGPRPGGKSAIRARPTRRAPR
jgi:AcrR family transcriptional regulator